MPAHCLQQCAPPPPTGGGRLPHHPSVSHHERRKLLVVVGNRTRIPRVELQRLPAEARGNRQRSE